MKIYLDIFFLVNTAMNFVILMLESFFQNRRIYVRKLLLASLAGAVFALILLVTGIHRHILFLLLFYLAGSIFIVRLAFGKTTAGALVRNVVLFYCAAFVLAGLLEQLQNVFHKEGSLVLLLMGAGGILVFVYRISPWGRRWKEMSRRYYPVRLIYCGKKISGKGLLDTGNHLMEPISHRPVMIGEKKFLTPLLKTEPIPVMRYIPYHSIGKERGILAAFCADVLEIQDDGGAWHCQKKTWIAISENHLSADGEYELILHPDITNIL